MSVLAMSTFALAGCAPPSLPARPAPGDATAGSSAEVAEVADVAHESGFFTGSDGTKLFEQSWRPRMRSTPYEPPRAIVVIHHGLKSHSSHYAELAHRLVVLGYGVYAYDMRGHGRSEGPRASLDDFDTLLNDLAVFLERVRAREPARPVFLLGHSVGGAVATLFTVERHPPIAGLVLLAPAIRVDRPLLLAAATPLSASLLPHFPAIDIPDESFSRDPETVASLAHDPLIHHSPAPARTARALLRAIERIWARAGTLDVPLLALHGTGDDVTDPRGSVEIVHRARTPPGDKALLLYGGLYHDLLHEPERARVMEDLTSWLERRRAQDDLEAPIRRQDHHR